MNRFFVLAGALVVALVAGSWLQGQDKKEVPTIRGKGALPAHYSKLGLSDEQKQRMYLIQNGFRTKIDELDKEIRKLKQMQRQKMEEVLTDAQKARLREILLEKAPAGSNPKEDKGKDDKEDKKTEKEGSGDKKQ
jgi:hypothetical protein